MENRLSVGISHGDVNGISYELIIKLLAENRMCELCVPILYGSPKVAAYYRKALNAETFALNPIKEPSEANGKRSNIINCADDEVKVELGKETDESDRAAMAALKRALDHADGGHIDVVVAAPQGKGMPPAAGPGAAPPAPSPLTPAPVFPLPPGRRRRPAPGTPGLPGRSSPPAA